MVFQAIIEPLFLARESDQQAGRLTVPRDYDLLGFSQMQKA